jgi:hypothetical protein
MISIFINHNRDEIRSFLNKKKLVYKNIENVNSNSLEDLARQQGIFDESVNYLIFEYPKNKEEASILNSDFLNFLITSPHNFYFECLCAKTSLPKKAQDFVITKDVKNSNTVGKKGSDVFALSDAVFSGNVSKAWLVFNKLKNDKSIESFEELHGTFLWAIKTILMSYDTVAKKTISPFVLNKIYKFKSEKSILVNYYEQALMLGINAHLGKVDFEKGFEKLILEMPK